MENGSSNTRMMKKTKKKRQKKIIDFVSCLRMQQKKDEIMEDQSTKLQKHDEQHKDEPICSKPSDDAQQLQRLDSTVSTQQQFQSSLPIADEQQNPDERESRKDYIAKIVKQLEEENVCRVVLHGKQGVGKTWIAKEVTKQAIVQKLFDVKIWVHHYPIKTIKGSTIHHVAPSLLYRSLCYQLSVQQDVDGGEYHVIDDEQPNDYYLPFLKERLKERKYLLVLDNVHPSAAQSVIELINHILIDSGGNKLSKVLITTSEKNDEMMTGDDTNNRVAVDVEIKPLTSSESNGLLHRRAGYNPLLLGDDVTGEIVNQCKYMPGAIVFTGNLLDYALKNAPPDELSKQVAINGAKTNVGDYWKLGFRRGYDKFTSNVTVLRCFLLCSSYLMVYGCINYNELILFWMLEGYLWDYTQGHSILMDLLDAGLLGEREAGDVVLENAGFDFSNHLVSEFCIHKHLLEISSDYKEIGGGGNVKLVNGRIAAFQKPGDENYQGLINLITLLVKGNETSRTDQVRINVQNVGDSFRVLSVSHAELIINLEHIRESLRVLILRNCYSVNHQIKISEIANLKHLKVLEISECSTLESIPEDFLGQFHSLESLNLSGAQIKSFPNPSSSKLRTLILRKCDQLESFPDVNGLDELEVLDLSGCNLKSLGTIKVWNLKGVPKLKVLDLSHTYIYEFPGLVNLENLTCLLVNNCPLLNKLRPLNALKKLQIIEASASKDLRFFREINLPSAGECLTKLDLSKTMIRKLPPLRNVRNLVYLILNGCSQLKELPIIQGAKSLRVLDVSDATQLDNINHGGVSFQDMNSLEELLLSNTKIKLLPPLSGLMSLQKLILRDCNTLESLPEMDFLTKLLLLDLQGCALLKTPLFGVQPTHVKILGSQFN